MRSIAESKSCVIIVILEVTETNDAISSYKVAYLIHNETQFLYKSDFRIYATETMNTFQGLKGAPVNIIV